MLGAGVTEILTVLAKEGLESELLDIPIRVPLSSSCISVAEYHVRTLIMVLTTARGGERNEYADVPIPIFLGLVTASSAGAFYNAVIRDRFSAP
jgi:hypothetical protein